MRLYGKRFVKRALERRKMSTAETRDGILWYIDEEDRVCRVKVQGSDKLVVAHYPRNWSKTPHWLKIGNAVRIVHKGGVRRLIEVVSDGRAIPTAVEGGTARPDPDPGTDAVLSGCTVEAITPNDMKVNVTPGYFRLNGVIYALGTLGASGIVMDDPAPMTMGEIYVMGQYIGYLDIEAAPATGYRYDIIVVGADLTIDVVKGTEAASDPTMPSTPTDHVLLGWILLYPGMTVITDEDINVYWTDPVPSGLELDYIPSQQVIWDNTNPPTVFVRCYMVDQYGNYYNTVDLQYMTLTNLIENSGDFCASPVSGACETYTYGTYCQWQWDWPATKLNGTYQNDADHSPVFKIIVDGSYLSTAGRLELYEAGVYIV